MRERFSLLRLKERFSLQRLRERFSLQRLRERFSLLRGLVYREVGFFSALGEEVFRFRV